MRRVTTIDEVRATSRAARADGRTVALVPTMGALHAGHLALVRAARARGELVVVSVFVNPTQFGPDEDLDAYPRDLEGDEAALQALGEAAPDVVFAPSVEEVYPHQRVTTVTVDRSMTGVLCGASRPGHFDGVTTVVCKLCNIVEPDVAVFGRKDYQQLAVLRAMCRDLDLPVELVGIPTVREHDGVAMSSRNAYLDGEDRAAARALSRALRAAVEAARAARAAGEVPTAGMLAEAASVTLDAEQRIRTDYVEVLDADTLRPPDAPRGEDTRPSASLDQPPGASARQRSLVAVAAHVGPARLIDNVVVGDLDDEERLLAATQDR